MKLTFTTKVIALLTFSLVTNVLSSFNLKNNFTKTANNSTLPFWQQPHIPDYAAELQKYNPSKKEPDKQQANEFLANAKQNVSFLENKGQMMDTEGKPVPFVLFKAEAPGMNVYITEKGLTYVFVKIEEEEKEERNRDKHPDLMLPSKHEENMKAEMAWINVTLKGASIKRESIIKEEQSTEHFNYFYGHCPNGIYDVYQYKKLTIKNVYPNIDWVFYNSSKGGMKYDFIVHPSANPNDIKLIYDSETPLTKDENGNLQLKTQLGSLTENAPYSYVQETNTEVKSSFKTTALSKHQVEVAFNINQNTYTQNSTLVIDPQLVWGTFYGGSNNDQALSIETDNFGNVFITGSTNSTNFPLQNAGTFFQTTLAGNFYDVFILKFSNNGNLLWATYYGGSGDEGALFIITDSSGNIFVAGRTDSSNFPLLNAGAGTFFQGIYAGNNDAFILKFTNNGTRLWATYYGGNNYDVIVYICEDLNGNVFFTGNTSSSNFPLQNAGTFFQGALGGASNAFILKFSNNGNRLWATYYGGSGSDNGASICTDFNGNVFVSGSADSPNFPLLNAGAGSFFQGINGGGGTFDAFILKFDNSGNRLWATYYGGSSFDLGSSILTDSNGNVFVSGATSSLNFPIQNASSFFQGTFSGGWLDAFILKFDNVGNRLWATYFGGSGNDRPVNPDNLVIDNCNNVYFGFETDSTSFPHLLNSNSCSYIDNSYNGGMSDNIIARFTNNGSLTWCTYLGGNGYDNFVALDIDLNSNLYISGMWSDLNLNGPITNASYPLVNPSGGAYYDNTFNGSDDSYIIKFSSALSYTSNITQPSSCNACDGSASFSISCGEAPFSYVWSNGTSVLNSTLTTSSISNLCPSVYNVTVTSACNQTVVQSYTIGFAGAIPTASVLPSNSICAGQNLTLTTVAASSHTWAGPNNFSSNLQNPTLTNLQLNNAGVYTLNVTSLGGCVGSTTVNLQVNSLPTVTASASNTSACQGQSLNLIGTSTATTFQWAGPNNYNSALQSPTLTNLQLNNAGVYTLNVTSASGCVSSATVSLVVNPLPAVSASLSNSACQGQSLSLVGTSTATTFQWSGPNNFSSSSQSPTLTNLQLTNGGIYTLNVTSANGCVNSATVNLVVIPLPTVSASLSNSPCFGQNVSLVGTSNATSFQWTGPNNFSSILQNPLFTNLQFNYNGVYILNVTSASGCFNSTSIILQVNPLPTVSASVSTSSPCEGQSVSLIASGTGNIFQWSGPNNYNSTGQTVSIQNLQLNQSGVYNLSATSLQGCINTTTVGFNVLKNPQAVILTNAVSACPPLCASYSFVPTADVASYTWLVPNRNTIANTPTVQTCYTSPGTYTMQLEVKGTNGCLAKGSYSLQVYPKPIADFVFNPTNPTLNDDDVVTFKDVTGYGAPTQWAWYFLTETKNTITKFGNEATYKYTEAGIYPISLVITNKYGCADTLVKSIVIADDYGLFIPNAFTPNNDGLNDIFQPQGHGIKSYTLVIFDRWGEQIYKTNHLEKGWDGYYKGELSKSDVYTWKITCVDVKNKSHELIGSVSLLR